MDEDGHFTGHKFRRLDEWCWRSLESSRFYFAAPEAMNDPADCQIDLRRAFLLARAGQDSDHTERAERLFLGFAQEVQAKARSCGVFSLCSGDIDGDGERLLWAHYAANHAGVCLTFEIPYSFVLGQLIGCAPVRYDAAELYASMRRLDLRKKPEFETDLKPIIAALLTTKAPEWAYERESRLIAVNSGEVSFDKSWLRQVCFGLRTSAEDRRRVTALVAGYPNCVLAETVPVVDDIFRIAVREVART